MILNRPSKHNDLSSIIFWQLILESFFNKLEKGFRLYSLSYTHNYEGKTIIEMNTQANVHPNR